MGIASPRIREARNDTLWQPRLRALLASALSLLRALRGEPSIAGGPKEDVGGRARPGHDDKKTRADWRVSRSNSTPTKSSWKRAMMAKRSLSELRDEMRAVARGEREASPLPAGSLLGTLSSQGNLDL